MLSPEDIKQVFFHCDHKDPDGYYADEVDIVEFGQKIAAFALAQRRPMDESQVIDFMLTVKLTEHGDDILGRIKSLIRAVEKHHGIN